MNKVRLGIIGPGLIWEKSHEPVLAEMNDFFSISAFSASSEKSAAKVQEKYPDLPFYFDYNELLKSPEIDAVVILTPIHLNAPITKAALQAGKMVFVEKPFCVSAAEGLKIEKLSQQTGLPVFILEQVVYNPFVKQVKELFNNGSIGTLVSFDLKGHFQFMKSENPDSFASTGWRQNPEFPLGTLADGGIHDLAKLSTMFGTPVSVTAKGWKLRDDFGEFDHILLMLEYADGIAGTLSHSAFLPGYYNMSVFGTDATYMDTGARKIIKAADKETELSCQPANSHMLMWNHFKACLEQNKEPDYSLNQALGDIKLLSAISESIKSCSKINIRH